MTDKVAVIGFGVTGRAAVEFLCAQGKQPIVLDTRPQPEGALRGGAEYFFECGRWPDIEVKEAILSPGLSLDSCLVKSAKAAGVRLLSDIDVFFANVNAPVIGVTGTNGKSTVTSWVAHCLRKAGLEAPAGGNLGQAALTLISPDVDFYVLELSSFQLERSQHHAFRVATVLNVTDDHIDQHGDMPRYLAAKQRINQRARTVIVNRQDAGSAAPAGFDGCEVSFGTDAPSSETDWGIREISDERYICRGSEPVMAVTQVSLSGEHNLQNALATAAIAGEFISLELIASGLASFAGLAHRFERVATVAGVTFINDSKATNVGATVAALSGFSRSAKVILIAGGDAKGGDIASLAPTLAGRVKAIVTLGKDANQFVNLARDSEILCEQVTDLPSAVERSFELAAEGDTVLLSPACASLDMFNNYADRGDQFKAAVAGLSR